jgi:hypothetical protein
MSSIRAPSAPVAREESFRDVVRRILTRKGSLTSTAEQQREQLFGEFLAALTQYRGEEDDSHLGEVLTLFLADERPHAEEWRASVPAAGGARTTVPLLPELARRLLALGYLHRPESGQEDPLLNPQAREAIDPTCGHEGLSFARAFRAIEEERSGLLAVVVGRRLSALDGPEAFALRWNWLAPLVKETAAQCLLTAGLAAPLPGSEASSLWRLLLAVYEQVYVTRYSDWPNNGPLAACCALGLFLTRPEDRRWAEDLSERVAFWAGWRDEDEWPTRYPAADVPALKALLTEQCCRSLGVADRKCWRLRYLHDLFGEEQPWPPLERFCAERHTSRPR